MSTSAMFDSRIEAAAKHFLGLAAKRFTITEGFLCEEWRPKTDGLASDAVVVVLICGDGWDYHLTLHELGKLCFDVALSFDIDLSPIPIRAYEWSHPEQCSKRALIELLKSHGHSIQVENDGTRH
jgi:hypothetical protein